MKQISEQGFLWGAIALWGTVFFAYASLRHFLLRSTGYDLGIFDHILYRLSTDQPPLEIFNDIHNPHHFLTDHFAWILYLIAGLYRLYPTVYWLFFLQAFGLALAAWPLWGILQHHTLPERVQKAIIWVYLLYPLIFNKNIFDFHTDAFAPLLLFGAILAVYRNQPLRFGGAILLLCGCKEIFALTVVGLGLWLCLGLKRYRYGLAAVCFGIGYFWLASQVFVPLFGKASLTAMGRYGSLGGSMAEIIQNLVFKPGLLAAHLFTFANAKYLVMLLLPIAWVLWPPVLMPQQSSWKTSLITLSPFLGAAPPLLLNLLTTFEGQKNLTNHHSLTIVPFLLMIVILALAQQRPGLPSGLKPGARFALPHPRWIVAWSLVGFMLLAKPGYLVGRFVEGLETWSASREAIALIDPQSPVLVPMQIAPHLTHRLKVGLTTDLYLNEDLRDYKYVLIDLVYPGIHTPVEVAETFQARVEADPRFELAFERDRVYLYVQPEFVNQT
ncbi:MAG: DUF2079 domain-containing protein [Cyanobacteria bacterium P01_G01_bin.54]